MAMISDKLNKILSAVFGKDVRRALHDGLEAVNNETIAATNLSKTTKERQDLLDSKFDEQIKNMTLQDPSSAEIVAMRTNNNGVTYETAGKRVAELESHLEENAKSIKQGTTFYSLPRRPLVTFIDDDGNKRIMERLYPLFKQKGVPCCCAIITSKTDVNLDFVTSDNIKTLVNEGWEMLGHGYDYSDNLSEFPNDDDLDFQLGAGCKGKLEAISPKVKVNGFVYPQSFQDRRIRRYTMKHYKYAFGDVGINTNKFLNSPLINRVAFGSYTSVNDAIDGERDTLDFYKKNVDKAIEKNGWLVFMVHCNDHSEQQQGYLSELLDYIKAKNVDIVTASQGYEIFGNQIFVGDLEEKFFIANENGIFTDETESKTLFKTKKIPNNSVTPLTKVDEFENLTITICEISNTFASQNGFPESVGGVLITYRYSPDVTYPNNNKQEYWSYSTDTIHRRTATSATKWGNWTNTEPLAIRPSNSYKESDLITAYPTNKITIFAVNGTNPFNGKSGIVTTYNVGALGWSRQELKEYNSNRLYARYTTSDGSWSSWEKLCGI